MPKLKPFFSYFGGKWRATSKYPKPKYDTIIEPFAGSAGYSMNYSENNIILLDKDPVISGLWTYLITATEDHIRSLPTIVDHIDELPKEYQDSKDLIGFWLQTAGTVPGKKRSTWAQQYPQWTWGPEKIERIASQLQFIRHWQIFEGNYTQAPDIEATWFIDPPYQEMGHRYTKSDINYEELATWCLSRKGQIIVCEKEGTTWLPFEFLTEVKARDTKFREAIFYRETEDV
jgi:site-specific DNA-adenine methylase